MKDQTLRKFHGLNSYHLLSEGWIIDSPHDGKHEVAEDVLTVGFNRPQNGQLFIVDCDDNSLTSVLDVLYLITRLEDVDTTFTNKRPWVGIIRRRKRGWIFVAVRAIVCFKAAHLRPHLQFDSRHQR